MKKWVWLLLFGLTMAGGSLYVVNRNKDKEAKRISEQFKDEGSGNTQAPPPPRLVQPQGAQQPSLPEARRGSGSSPPSYPTDPNMPPPQPDQFGNPNLPPPQAFDNMPPPSQAYPDAPPVPYIPPEPDEFGEPGEPPDPYEGIDPQYIPNSPLDGEIVPPQPDGGFQ